MPYPIAEKIVSWCPPETIEPQALQQLYNVAQLPFIFQHLAVMPDCHYGMGATVGSVIATQGAIVPAAVGVDIGCGMVAVRTPFTASQLPETLEPLRKGIERRIPASAGGRNKSLSESARDRCALLDRAATERKYRQVEPSWPHQLGSLGSGNHFIEICLDESDTVWTVLHSGSRGIGNKLAQRHIKVAQKLMDTWHIALPDKDLAYLAEGTPEFQSYIEDLLWAQEFATHNRDEMVERVLMEVATVMLGDYRGWPEVEVERINCHHNFTQREQHMGQNVWVTRKGAIQMRPGKLGVIPGSMGTRSYIVEGLGHPASFESAPHGAGRRFSRAEARRRFTMADYDIAMAGIECRRSEKLIDELPGCYKDIDEVMEHSKDLVQIRHELRQIVNVKGD